MESVGTDRGDFGKPKCAGLNGAVPLNRDTGMPFRP